MLLRVDIRAHHKLRYRHHKDACPTEPSLLQHDVGISGIAAPPQPLAVHGNAAWAVSQAPE